MDDNRTRVQLLFAAKAEPSAEVYTAEDVICLDKYGNVVPVDEGIHVFLSAGETCPLQLAKQLDLPGANAVNAEDQAVASAD